MKIKTLYPNSDEFPKSLCDIHKAPEKLFSLGSLPVDDAPVLAVVGSRKPTTYGLGVTKKLIAELASHGVSIISGLALGIDATAHRAAIEAGGHTLAVMPCGLDRIYPASHVHLAKEILFARGGLLSEYEAGMPPQKHHFIARNRLVSGLADAVLVVEAAERSGTLATVNFALEQGKTVLAVPGNITSLLSQGTNNLIKTGATPVTSAQDVLHALGLEAEDMRQPTPVAQTPQEQVLIELLTNGVTSAEELLRSSHLKIDEFNSSLTMLEITGRIRSVGNGSYILL